MAQPTRRVTRQMMVGNVPLGGNTPVTVQTMTKTHTEDVEATLAQIRKAEEVGCDIIRCALPTVKTVPAFREIVKQSPLPVVADIHFDTRIAVSAIEAGAAKIRINPGNMGNWDAIERVVETAKSAGIPIRIGVNSGSIKHKNPDDPRSLEEALAGEALAYAARFEEMGFHDIVLSLKSPDPLETIRVNRLVAAQCDYPLHIGVTHAGPEEEALLKSAIGIGGLLADGIGDTIRLSFTGSPSSEVVAGRKLLRAAGLLKDGPELISCPTCGRCTVDLQTLVKEVQSKLKDIHAPIKVAVMGCEVNGPGEAKEADVGIASAGGRVTLFLQGETVRTVPVEEAVDALLAEVRRLEATYNDTL